MRGATAFAGVRPARVDCRALSAPGRPRRCRRMRSPAREHSRNPTPSPFAVRSPNMKVLVTGASGFIGQALVPRLASRGHEVRALARHAEAVIARPHVEPFQGDLLDPA